MGQYCRFRGCTGKLSRVADYFQLIYIVPWFEPLTNSMNKIHWACNPSSTRNLIYTPDVHIIGESNNELHHLQSINHAKLCC
jgi:hypothetical protein